MCRRCGSTVGIFPDQDLDWRHYTGEGATSGAQVTYDPGHQAEVIWLLSDEDLETLSPRDLRHGPPATPREDHSSRGAAH